ncbi:Hint domain-containing protein [Pseudooceanicola sp. C21-150M6]|uniref:Hint domain-containing protein n=1 Tax=Pseudooceanicola sp. C21-150M6 TaxID=3434355 RepID=UPI003D7FCFD3
MKPTEPEATARPAVDEAVRGLLPGTMVMTLEGEMPVEYLSIGDRIVTRDTGMARLSGIRVHRQRCATIVITGGSLGHNRPESDVVVPDTQEILIRDWRAQAIYGQKTALIPASRLVDGEYIRPAGMQTVTLFELVFEAEHIIYAGGLEIASSRQEALLSA